MSSGAGAVSGAGSGSSGDGWPGDVWPGDVWPDDVVAVLDTVESLHAARLSAEADLFVLATRFADLQAGESLTGRRGVEPGGERAVRLGGVGTPRVREFACAEFGARVQMGTVAARHYLA